MPDCVLTTCRFLAYLPHPRSDRPMLDLARLSRAAARLGLRPIETSGFLFAFAEGRSAPLDPSGLLLMDVFPGTAASIGRRSMPANTDWKAAHDFAETRAQFYNLIHVTGASFRLESDRLGLKPYYIADDGSGTVVASRCADIIRLFPDMARPADKQAIYQLFVFKAPLGDRTLHRSIKRGDIGSCCSWDPAGGFVRSTERRVPVPAVEAHRLNDVAMARLKDALGASIERRTAGLERPIGISLSGGFDSRLLAAMATASGVRIQAFTFGRGFHSEVHCAKAIAGILGIDHEILAYPPENALNRISVALRLLEGMADLGIVHIANLLELPAELGAPMMHGYLGDVPSGLHIHRIPAGRYQSLDQLADEIAETNTKLLPLSDAEAILGHGLSADDLRHEIRGSLRSDATPIQAYVLWDIEARQRRYIASFFPTMGEKFHTIAPYYDRELIEFWLSMPPIALHKRTFLRRFMASQFPRLANVRHPEEPLPITANLQMQVRDFSRDLPRKTLRAVLGPNRAHDLFIRWNRSRTIWTFGNLLGPGSQARMLSRSTALRSAIDAALGIEVGSSFAAVLERNQQALRNFYLLAEYAAWLDTEPSEPTTVSP